MKTRAAPARALQRILLIEDNAGDAGLVRFMLGDSGASAFDVVHVTRLSEAWSRVDNLSFDCALLDLSLPDADGLEGVVQLRERAPNLPVIVLTGREDLELAIEALQRGAQDYLLKGRVDAAMLKRSLRYAVERKHADVALAFAALHDSLTGLPNRTLFVDRLQQAVAARSRQVTAVAVIFLDLDRFKVVNDSLGHAAGDQVLVTLAARLAAVLRPGDTLARFGGDEFTVLCQNLSAPDEGIAIIERLTEALEAPIDISGAEMVLTASIGIAFGEPRDPAETLIRNADAAMYRAKEAGGDCWLVYDQGIHRRAVERLETEVALRRALDLGELRLEYQPIVRGSDGSLAGVEALLRWHHPTRGVVSPEDFIGLAEETGLIEAIGAWVLDSACAHTARQTGVEGGFVSVNVSARQLTSAKFVASVSRALDRSRIAPDRLWLEITENALIADLERAMDTLQGLRDLGVKLAVDDFGTGYTTLGNLKRFPMDVIKIDRSFISGLGPNRDDTAITKAVIQLAHTLGLATTAEGVETADQQGLLRELGCDYLQGFHIGAPAAVLTGRRTRARVVSAPK